MQSDYPGARVAAGQLVRGYGAAALRFDQATSTLRDPGPGFFALFEALNWAVALDDLICETWVPEGSRLGWGWRARAGGEQLTELVNATRHARNLVHHHWADALRLEEGACFPMRFPVSFHTWAWRPVDELPPSPDERHRDAYQRRLAGVRAADSLHELGEAFDRVGLLLDPPRPPAPTDD